MRCYICDFNPNSPEKSTNFLTEDLRTGLFICAICRDSVVETLLEFDTDKCSDEYKREHGIKEKS